jgi:hypothetical protein
LATERRESAAFAGGDDAAAHQQNGFAHIYFENEVFRFSFVAQPARLERDGIRLNRHRALDPCLSMIFSENRYPLFRIMLLVQRGLHGKLRLHDVVARGERAGAGLSANEDGLSIIEPTALQSY